MDAASDTRRSQPAFANAPNSTTSLTMGSPQNTLMANAQQQQGLGGDYDIEISQPDPIFLSQWCCVPIRCTLAAEDRKTEGRIEERYFTCEYIVPRQSYLFMHCETITESFKNVVANEGFPWLSYRVDDKTQVVLPWQYPVSVVIDMMRMRRRVTNNTSAAMISAGYEERIYPFEITLHFSAPKSTDPTFLGYLKSLRVSQGMKGGMLFLRQLIKRSTCYAYGSTIPLLELEVNHPEHFTDLFEGIQENDPEKFWRGRCGLRYYGEVVREDEVIESTIINVHPLSTAVGGSGAAASATAPPVSTSTSADALTSGANATAGDASNAQGGGGQIYSLADLQAFPIVLHCEGTSKIIRWKKVHNQKLGQFLKEHVPWLEFLTKDDIFHRHEPAHFVLIQGLSPFLSSPMEDLYELLASTDLFLHIVIRPIFVPAS